MTSTSSVNNATYDPKTDKARKAHSNDPGWKYGYWTNLGNRDQVTCTLCDTMICGGIKRLKQHLAGGYADTKMCLKTTTATRKEMRDYLESNKRKRPLFIDDEQQDKDRDVVVVDLEKDQDVVGSSQCSKVPSSGTAAKQRRAAYLYKPPTSSKTNAVPKENESVMEMLRKTPEELVDERRKGCSQPTIPAKMKSKEEKDYVDMQWAMWFYECGIPFNAAASRQFEIAIEATARFGSGYKPPSRYQFGQPILKDAVKLTSAMREDHERAWKHYGCTLMSDGWSDKRGRHLINFLANSPEGTYFLGSVDASSEIHDAFMLADLLEQKIDEIGREKVVQVITDNGANYKAAGRILMERIPSLFWSPCAAHCLDLMLEDIGNLKEFKKLIARAKRVTTFIYRHGRILSLMREKTGADLVRPAATRFATSFLTLKSLHKHRDALKALFVSEDWNGNRLAKTAAGEEAHDIVLSVEFWNKVEDCLRASAPLLIVLRVVDGDEKPAMPEVAALMKHAKDKIKLSFAIDSKKTLLKKIMDIIERRWMKQMNHPLYGAALYLNPGKLHPLIRDDDDETVGQLRGSFLDVLARMVEDQDTRHKIDSQSLDYEGLRGAAFSNRLAIKNLETISPLDWWRSYGGRAIELQRFARRIVGLCASSSGCERNWSTFEFDCTLLLGRRKESRKKRDRCCKKMKVHNVPREQPMPAPQPWGPPPPWSHPPNIPPGGPGYGGNPHFMPPRPQDNYYPPPDVHPVEKQPHYGISSYGRDAPPSGAPPTSGNQHLPHGSSQTQKMQVPLSYADAVIGSAGANISYIRKHSGATISIQEGVPGEMTVEMTGSASQVQTAQQLIKNFMAEASPQVPPPGPAPPSQPVDASYNSYQPYGGPSYGSPPGGAGPGPHNGGSYGGAHYPPNYGY